MHAVILAGGKGTRLRPYTTCVPKPLVPIGDTYSILEIVLYQLRAHGFTSVTLAVGHMGHLIRAFVGDGSRYGLQVDYTDEETPLGTIGPVLNVLDTLPEHFLVMNGDVLTNLNYGTFLQRHIQSDRPVTVATYNREIKSEFGVLDIDETGSQIVAFREKPTVHFQVSMGIYAVTRQTLRGYTPGQVLGFDTLMLDLLAARQFPGSDLFGGYWLDIGRPEDYDMANREWEEMSAILLPHLTLSAAD
ncbi:NDP-sugar synthase [Deinococcus radiopugnans]|uniref:Mannose-1-phosphate guanylyltransferase n=1 Tax=Deinococcus radiopugnans ATCC 19172 TaxID=585398 RepID=A0A5C4YA02_9DEIO|nr:nucleotidyltransferase family protein [Deinococcus radiopugnans]MBB6015906.1 mannose-1-phosphate guanylyltransferase [Deinococcus radiopugnans ATCC 19172]TNM72399.1 nucleotidyltransferase family protein [Deinococcus radiopugnans ATCC 19172]